ncbi:hypothetical protein [Vibrio cyclitrophicus]|uniref:hypothetical protein n=1 Tax=Vibrio cyclitrophicus TaxID=47951 RepID=UPI00399C410E
MTKGTKDNRGAKKGENRFANSQKEKINIRTDCIKQVVAPKIRAICENTHFKNVTSYRKVCAVIYNAELPAGEREITYRTIARSPYWDVLGGIYHSFFTHETESKVNGMLNSLAILEEVDDLKLQVKKANDLLLQKDVDLKTMESVLLNCGEFNPLSLTQNIEGPLYDLEVITNLVATINWLVERTDDVIEINKKSKEIRDLSDDFNGVLDKRISKTFFDYLDGNLP